VAGLRKKREKEGRREERKGGLPARKWGQSGKHMYLDGHCSRTMTKGWDPRRDGHGYLLVGSLLSKEEGRYRTSISLGRGENPGRKGGGGPERGSPLEKGGRGSNGMKGRRVELEAQRVKAGGERKGEQSYCFSGHRREAKKEVS